MNQVRVIDIRLLGKKRTGDEAVFFNLTKEVLALDKANQYLLLTDEQDEQNMTLLEKRLGCVGQKNVRFVSLFGKNRFVWNLFSLPWFLLCHRVDVYHTQYILPFFVPKRTKVVNHIHDVSFVAYPKLIGWKDRLFLSLLIPRSLRRADSIIAPSQFTKDEIVRYYGITESKVTVISNALGEDFLKNNTINEERVREKYALPERFILAVGTLQPRKNIPFLIRAFARVHKRLPDTSLVLVGSRGGHHFDTGIDRVLKELDMTSSVYFPGYIEEDDLPVLMRAASVFAFPSLYEGFGIPLLEAMSQDVPVASSDIPCLREIAGEAALYFDPTSLASCEEKLYTLLTDMEQQEKGISLGRHRVSLFSWKKSAAALLSVYDALV